MIYNEPGFKHESEGSIGTYKKRVGTSVTAGIAGTFIKDIGTSVKEKIGYK